MKNAPSFNQSDLETYINECKSRYEPSQQFIFTTPNELLAGLEKLFSEGFTASSQYTHQLLPPSYYSVWLEKPLHQRQSELVEVVTKAEATYRDQLEESKRIWLKTQALAALEAEEAAKAQAAQAKREKRLAEIEKQLAQQGA